MISPFRVLGWTLGCAVIFLPQASQAAPSVADALKLKPVQQGIQVDHPTEQEMQHCTIKAEKLNGSPAWVVRGPNGVLVRLFSDSNNDNVVDTWSYFRAGLEVYRDIDSNNNGKADQYRWFHWAGTRWGINTDGDSENSIDNWKLISPEETAEQVVLALRNSDVKRFESLVLQPDEISKLGLAPAQAEKLAKRAKAAIATFKRLLNSEELDKDCEFSDFGGLKPGMVPAGTNGASKDVMVYENTWAMVKSGEDHPQIQLGTMVSMKGAWKLIDGPVLGSSQEGLGGFFFVPDSGGGAGVGTVANLGDQPTERVQELLASLEKLDAQIATSADKEKPALNASRADLLETIAGVMPNPAERVQWLKQLADMVSAATQGGIYPEGVDFLRGMEEKLQAAKESADIVAYFEFHRMLAEYYSETLADPDVNYAKAQAKWQEDLEAFVQRYPKSEHGAEALRMLATNSEMAGDDEAAVKWYGQVLDGYPQSQAAAIAKGAVVRLTSKGRQIRLQGDAVRGGKVDLSDYRDKVVVIQYWTTSSDICKADHAVLGDLYKKYGGSRGLEIIGVNLNFVRNDLLTYLEANRLPWKQLHEKGGFDSRLAKEMGVVTVPLMLLVGPKGLVISNNVQAAEIEAELKKLLPAVRQVRNARPIVE